MECKARRAGYPLTPALQETDARGKNYLAETRTDFFRHGRPAASPVTRRANSGARRWLARQADPSATRHSPLVTRLSSQHSLSPLECALTKNASVSPAESALSFLLDLKPRRINTYRKHRGVGALTVNFLWPPRNSLLGYSEGSARR